jgi:hypothetical protein
MTSSREEIYKQEIAHLTEQLYNAYKRIKDLKEQVSYGESNREDSGATDKSS